MFDYQAHAEAIRIQRAHIHAHRRYALARAVEERKLRIHGHPLADPKYYEIIFALGRHEQHPEFGRRDLFWLPSILQRHTIRLPKGHIHIDKF